MKPRTPAPRMKPRPAIGQRMRHRVGRMGRSLALSAALAAAACATTPESTLPIASRPRPPTAADYEPARRAAKEMRSIRRNPAHVKSIEKSVRSQVKETLAKMQEEFLREQEKANKEQRPLANDLASKFHGYPPVLRSALIEHYRTYWRLFMEVNLQAGEILNRAGHRERVNAMLRGEPPIVRYDGAQGRFVLNVDPHIDSATLQRLGRILPSFDEGMAENTERADKRIEAFIQRQTDDAIQRVDAEAEAERAADELRKKMHGPR